MKILPVQPSGNPAIWSRASQVLAIAVLAGIAVDVLRADVAMAPAFTDHAVLQRDRRIPIWGTADAGEKVAVRFQERTAATTAADDGTWFVWIDPVAATREGQVLTVTGKNTVTLHDVVVGDVWFCSGQSNMGFALSRSANAATEIAAADYPLIRQLFTDRTVAEKPARTVKSKGWIPASPKTAAGFTAVGYFFAREIHQKTGVPIGIIHSSWPGTPIESWLATSALSANPAFAVVAERYQQALAVFPEKNPPYLEARAAWEAGEAAARADGSNARTAYLKQHPAPIQPVGPGHPLRPGGLFNAMVAPFIPYALRGFIWYQGEGNANRASEYRALFAALITDWRKQFGQGDLPFYWVQLANFSAGNPTGTNWAQLREAQSTALQLPATGQAITIDVGNPDDIHPTNKQAVGHRLALLAGGQLYGLKDPSSGPIFLRAERDGMALRLHFDHTEGGLQTANGFVTSLQLAGIDGKFLPATGRISGDSIIATAPEVPNPVAVRYAWSNSPAANLYNGAGLPAAPFRSDR